LVVTCIVGLRHKGKVYIGGDSAGVAGWDLQVRADRKVFVNGPFAFGFCGSFRLSQILPYSFAPPKRNAEKDVYAFMVTEFVDAERSARKSGGWAKKENEVEKGGFFLVGYAGRLFYVESDYQVGEASVDYNATGCGSSYAIGSLYTSKGEPKSRVKLALQCAESNSAGVRGPFHIVSV